MTHLAPLRRRPFNCRKCGHLNIPPRCIVLVRAAAIGAVHNSENPADFRWPFHVFHVRCRRCWWCWCWCGLGSSKKGENPKTNNTITLFYEIRHRVQWLERGALENAIATYCNRKIKENAILRLLLQLYFRKLNERIIFGNRKKGSTGRFDEISRPGDTI